MLHDSHNKSYGNNYNYYVIDMYNNMNKLICN